MFENDSLLSMLPNKLSTPIDSFAYQTLVVMGLIEAIHGGKKVIYILQRNADLIRESDAFHALCKCGWRFYILPENIPEL